MAGNPNLPGMNVTLNDLGLKVAPPPAGPKVTILGVTSNTGVPLLEPFTVSSVEKAMNTLWFHSGEPGAQKETGRYPGEISLAIEQAVSAGAPNIEVVVIAHKTGDQLLDYTSVSGNKTGRYTDLSGAYDIIRNTNLDVVFPAGAYMDYTDTGLAFTDNFGKQLADLCFQATQESNACVGVIPTRPIIEWAQAHAFPLTHKTDATVVAAASQHSGFAHTANKSILADEISGLLWKPGGTARDEVHMRKQALFATPSANLVKEWHAYHAYPEEAGKFKTMVTGEYNTIYRNWLRGAEDDAGSTHLPTSTAAVTLHPNYFNSWQAKDSTFANAVDGRGVKVDAGAFVNVFSAPIKGPTTQMSDLARAVDGSPASVSYNSTGGAAYAGLITSLAPQSATTNKFIEGIQALKFLSPTQANDLVKRRHTTMYNRSTGFVVASGVTGAHNLTNYIRSDYARLSTVRITHAAVDLIRAVGDKYIGEPNNAPQINALRAEVDQVLLSMKGSGAVRAYDFVVQSTPDQRVLGQVDINLTIVPAFEVVTINLTVSLAKEL